jgi:hypothetical protein
MVGTGASQIAAPTNQGGGTIIVNVELSSRQSRFLDSGPGLRASAGTLMPQHGFIDQMTIYISSLKWPEPC